MRTLQVSGDMIQTWLLSLIVSLRAVQRVRPRIQRGGEGMDEGASRRPRLPLFRHRRLRQCNGGVPKGMRAGTHCQA